jgi:hypothetical protein
MAKYGEKIFGSNIRKWLEINEGKIEGCEDEPQEIENENARIRQR